MIWNKNKKTKKISMYDKSDERDDRLIEWITFYRRNVELFVEHYLSIKLHPFQKIIIHLMGVNNVLNWIASRSIGKSWLTGLYACCMAILYPNSLIVISSKTLPQAGIIIEKKIQNELCGMSPNLRKEISNIQANGSKYKVNFNNGSTIEVVVASENGRGNRSHFLILEEYRLLDKGRVDSILLPLNKPRTPPYTFLDKYKKLKVEQSKKVFISSAYWKSNWMWNQIKSNATDMVNGQKKCVIALDLFLALEHQIKTYEDIYGDKETMDELTFRMEYYNEMIGEANNAYYKLEEINNCRNLKDAFVPLDKYQLLNSKHMINCYNKKRLNGEIRIIEVDIALKRGKNNDNTIIGCTYAEPNEGIGYERYTPYIESHNGLETFSQALRIKQLYYEFKADYVVLDTLNGGISIYDELAKTQIDEETGEKYPAWTIINDTSLHVVNQDTLKDFRERVVSENAIPVIFPIQGTLNLNSEIAMDFKKQFEKGKIHLLIDEQKADAYLMQNDSEYLKDKENNSRIKKILPFKQTSELIHECINLEVSIVNGNIKLSEPPSGRKDRYSSISYGNYFISLKEREFLKGTQYKYSAESYSQSMNKIISKKQNIKNKYFL